MLKGLRINVGLLWEPMDLKDLKVKPIQGKYITCYDYSVSVFRHIMMVQNMNQMGDETSFRKQMAFT